MTPARARRTTRVAVCGLAVVSACAASHAQVMVGPAEYHRLATREATRAAMLAVLTGTGVRWGEWSLLAPISHPAGARDIATPYPPEEELARMAPGGPGPRLDASYEGKGGPAVWHGVLERPDIGGIGGLRPIDLREGLSADRGVNAVGYLYRRIDADRAGDVEVLLGSDDGVRVWLNGELVLDENAERPLDPNAHRLTLRLRAGVNHLFVKVSQGGGEWEFQFAPELNIDPEAEARLEWQLDEDFPDAESRYYRIATIPHPREIALEVGGLDVVATGAAADEPPVVLCTRRGEVYRVDGAYRTPPARAVFTRLAFGLQEPLGLRVQPVGSGTKDRQPFALVAAQRGELTRLVDVDGDGQCEGFETLCADWTISGNYHEYAFGPKFDGDGNAWVTLNLAHTGGETTMGATVPTRGWAVKIPLEGAGSGRMVKIADGLRSPDGVGLGPDGEMFYTDNQGDWVATNKLSHLKPGSFHGHQASLKFREGYGPDWKKEGKPVPEVTWPAVWFPYKKMGQSASDILLDDTGGRFGPFEGQMFVGEQTYCQVFRVFLEKVGGEYQGACFPFRSGFRSGVHRLAFALDGSMFVGMTDRGWGSTGPKRDGLQRLLWTGRVPLEIRAMRVRPRGFELEFTRDVDDGAADPARYRVISYTYDYHPEYGSDEVDTREHAVLGAARLGPRTVELNLDAVRSGGMGYVHELTATGIRSKPDGAGRREELLHDKAYYTVQHVPDR
jgi:hypothetical protein